MARQVDFIMLNAYAFFENRDNTSKIPCIQPADAAAAHVNRLTTVASMYPTMPVMLSESGWPGPPPAVAPTGWRDQKADRKCKGTDGAVTSRAIQSYVAAHTLKVCTLSSWCGGLALRMLRLTRAVAICISPPHQITCRRAVIMPLAALCDASCSKR